MTYKYLEVRREIYEKCSDKTLKKFRTFKEIRKLFKRDYWVLVGLMALCFIIGFILVALYPQKLWYAIPSGVCYIIFVVSEYNSEKFYNPLERTKELSESKSTYDEYTKNIIKVLNECGIDNENKRKMLKEECKNKLALHSKTHNIVNSKVYDMLIGVPLGALISSLIYKSEEEILTPILGLIIIGVMIIIFSKVVRQLRYYSDGYFKDQYLFNVLNEVEYNL